MRRIRVQKVEGDKDNGNGNSNSNRANLGNKAPLLAVLWTDSKSARHILCNRDCDYTMNSTAASPMHPVAPPSKKQRSSRDALSTAADDAIARRRAELRRLQDMKSQHGLLDQARSQLGDGAPPPAMPPPQHVARTRHSDIFPNVTKAPPKPTPRVARRLDATFETPRSRAKSAPPMRPPPPPPTPQLVAEAPPERTSPIVPPSVPTPAISSSSSSSSSTKEPSTERRDMLRNLYDLADTPPKESADLRLVKELKQAQDDKADALRKVARLRKQIHQLQQQPANEGAVVSTPISQVGFLSPLNASPARRLSATPMGGGSTRKRVATPHPKRRTTEQDSQANTYLQEAAKTIPYEYYSSQATYVVRRPYSAKEDDTLWAEAGTQSTGAYQSTVNVNKPSTLEVAAKITADGSLLTLNGTCTVRHKNATEWRVFDNVDEMDKPLGCVMYIDGDANEKEYWLGT